MSADQDVARTPAELKAVAALERLAKAWPKSLTLFSWSGSLIVMRTEDRGSANYNTIQYIPISGIPNDGGDP